MPYKKRMSRLPKGFEDDLTDDEYSDEFDDSGLDDDLNYDAPLNSRQQVPNDDDLDLDISSDEDDDYNYDINDGMGDFGGGGPNPMEKHNDLLKDLTNFDPYLKKKMYDWMGYKWDDDKARYVPEPDIEALLNYKGAKRLISILGTYTRGNNILTNLDDNSYKELIGDLVETLCYSIGPDMQEYGIESNSKFLLLINDIEAAVKLVLQGAGGGKYTEFLGTTIQRNESVSGNIQNQQQGPQIKTGFWGKTKNMLMGTRGN